MDNLTQFISNDFAPLGRYFCNPPPLLFEKLLQHMKHKRENSTVDVIFITGDIIGHRNNNEREDLPEWDS